jgi:PAS domain S-box-containing protein
MKRTFKNLRLQYRLFIGCLALIVIVGVSVIQYVIQQQNEDSKFIGLAGRQAMLCQRIAKLSLLIEKDFLQRDIKSARRDTLIKLVNELRSIHYTLLDQSDVQNSIYTDSLLRANTPLLESTFYSAGILTNPSDEHFLHEAVETIDRNDRLLAQSTQAILVSYQNHAESKLSKSKSLLNLVSAIAFITMILGLTFILRPSFSKLERSNKELTELNEKLQASYQELQATEEEIRGNLEHIQILQEHLETKEKQYRELIENAEEVIYELDEDGKFTYLNPTTEVITEYTQAELLHKPYWRILHPDNKEDVMDFYMTQTKSRQVKSYYEVAIVTATGRTVWLSQNVRLFISENGWIHKVSVIARDITLLKETQDKLKKSEKQYRLISTNSKDLISLYDVDIDSDPIRSYVSPSVKDILGYEQEEVIGQSPFKFIHPEDVERMKKNVHPATLNGEMAFAEYRAVRKDGKYIWMESYSQPYVDDEGKVIGFQTSARDITKRKETEISLKEAKEKAEEATNAKSQFLSMMSHEIRTPMNAVIGLTNFLLEENPREDQMRHLKLLKFSSENLLTIINDILDFSKIEAGKVQIESIPIHLANFLNDIVQSIKIKADDKGIMMTSSYDEKLPSAIYGDPVRISQVINNLLSNAIKFTKRGKVEFIVNYAGADHGRSVIAFSVKDTGIGIEQDKLEIIFDQFSQANTDTARMFGGTGLGLAITKKLLNLMGSEITVKSQLGEGSEFSFALNVEEAKAVQLLDKDNQLRANRRNHAAHILLVEDNDVNQIVATNFLTKWGYRVTIANNGKEALEMVKHKSYHLILIDLQMPEMDGYEATSKIRGMSEPYFEKIPIIAITASTMANMENKLTSVGITDYITKPFRSKDLEEKILQYEFDVSDHVSKRSLRDALNDYSESNEEVNLDLVKRMIKNINELQTTLDQSLKTSDVTFFANTGHKMRTTFGILQKERFISGMEEIKHLIILRNDLTDQLDAKIDLFKSICNESIEELDTYSRQYSNS